MKIYKVFFSQQDSLNLAGRESPKNLKNENDFMRLIVEKPWGSEYLMFENPFAQVWSLFIKKKAMTSTHTHPNKKTALILISGRAIFKTLNTSIPLKPLDAVTIDPAVFHTTQAISEEGARILEIETPPLKYDLIRMKDKYGREGKFYEGRDHMHENKNECVRFIGMESEKFKQQAFFEAVLSLKKIEKAYTQEDLFHLSSHDILGVLEGNIHSKNGNLLYSVADVVKCSDFMSHIDSHSINNLTLLLIRLS